MEPDVLNEVCAKADAARIAQAQLAQTNTQRKNELLNAIADALDANSTDSNLTCPASTQPHKVCAT